MGRYSNGRIRLCHLPRLIFNRYFPHTLTGKESINE
jgi:hypothetical protein